VPYFFYFSTGPILRLLGKLFVNSGCFQNKQQCSKVILQKLIGGSADTPIAPFLSLINFCAPPRPTNSFAPSYASKRFTKTNYSRNNPILID